MNNNRIIYGGQLLYSMNISTGQCSKIFSAKQAVVCLTFCANGRFAFLADHNGGLSCFATDTNSRGDTNFTKIRRFLICPNSKISNLSVNSHSNPHSNFDVLISTNESLMLFAITNHNHNHNPIIKMVKRWSLRTSVAKSPLSPTLPGSDSYLS